MDIGILDFLVQNIGSQGIFFALFLYLFYTSSKEGKDREIRLQDQLDKSNEQLDKAMDTLDKLADKYDILIGEIRELKGRIKD